MRGFSLHIGVNRVDPNHYAGWNRLNWTTKQLVAGDTFLITFAGHGVQVLKLNGDEAESLDETWVLHTGHHQTAYGHKSRAPPRTFNIANLVHGNHYGSIPKPDKAMLV